jgi:transposase
MCHQHWASRFDVDRIALAVILGPKLEPRIMRYELSNYEWGVINPMLPNKPRGVARVDDRRILNGIFWILRSGAPWRDLPDYHGPYTTCYNRFVRWCRAGMWDQLMNALTAGHDATVQMIDTSVVCVHQHGASIARNAEQHMGRSRGGLTSKIHAVVRFAGTPRAYARRGARQQAMPGSPKRIASTNDAAGRSRI